MAAKACQYYIINSSLVLSHFIKQKVQLSADKAKKISLMRKHQPNLKKTASR